MAISIVNQWPATWGDTDKEIVAAPTPGRTLIAVIVSRVVDGSAPTLAIGDVSRNGWTLLADPIQFATSAHAAAQLQCEIWACPAVRYDGWPFHLIYASATQITVYDVGSCAVNVVEVNGLLNQLAVDAVVVGTATNSNTLVLAAPTPAANSFMLAAAATDVAYASYTATGTGWTQLNNVTNTAPDVGLLHAWREATTGGGVTFTLPGGVLKNWAGVLVSLRTAGVTPAQPNPAWPATSLQVGLGYDLSTPLSRVHWTDQTSRYLSLDSERGIQAELGTAQQGNTTLVLRDDDGAYTPRAVALAATATASGTTTTIKVADASAANIHIADFFRISRAALNVNTGLESGTAGWSATGGALTSVTSPVRSGSAAMNLTPDGVTATVQVKPTTHTPVTAGTTYVFSAWVQCAAARTVELRSIWLDSSNAFISNNIASVSVAAGAWMFLTSTATAPVGAASVDIAPTMTGTPPVSHVLTLDDVAVQPAPELAVFQVTGLNPVAGTTTITFKRADGTAGGALASTASGDIYAGIAVDLYIPWRLQKTVAGTTYTVGSGWLRDLPVAFDDAHWAEVNAAGADALEALSAVDNPSALRGEIYRRTSLYAYWPLDDSAGGGYAANASGVSNATLTQTVSKYGAGTSTTADFGATTQGINMGVSAGETFLLGDPGTGWAQDGQTAAEMATKGYALVGSDPNMPSITNGVTVFGFTAITGDQGATIGSATIDPTLCILRNTDPATGVGQGSIIKISIQRALPNWPIVTRWDKTTHATTSTTCSGGFGFGIDWAAWALTFDRTSWAMYIDGGLVGSGSCNLVASWSGIDIGGEADPFWHGRTFPGTHAHIGVYGRRLTAGEILRISDSGAFAFYQTNAEQTNTRIQKKLGAVGWKNTRVLNPGPASLSAEAPPSGSVADLASNMAAAEDSLAFTDAGNQFQYRSRLVGYQQFPRAILGDDTGSGEIPYQPGQLFDFNPTYIYNDVEVSNTNLGTTSNQGTTTNLDLQVASTFVAIDDISAARYGARTMTLATRFLASVSAWDIAWWLLARYAYPQMRVGSVVVSAAASNDTASSAGRWAFICGVEVGDIVVVNRRPIGQPMISVRCRVLSVQPAFKRDDGNVTGQATLTLGAAPPLVPITNDTTYGVIGGTVVGA